MSTEAALDHSERARDHGGAVTERSKPDDVQLVPITEQIEARVQDAVGEVAGVPEPRAEPSPEPEALELAEVTPFVRPKETNDPEPPLTAFEVKRGLRRVFKLAAIAAVLAALAIGALVLLSGRADTLLDGDSLWTFTDKNGVVHIVDDLDKVPAEHRKQATRAR